MNGTEMIKAWKDSEFRASLSAEQQSMIPENPAGMIELSDEELSAVAGGLPGVTIGGTCRIWTFGCCEPPK
jgi:mersacidin/lichenicidin family type 2 lantibiotic